jgi:hypothetical protein
MELNEFRSRGRAYVGMNTQLNAGAFAASSLRLAS